MTVLSSRTPVATTPTKIADATIGTPNDGRNSILIMNNGASTIYVGGPQVSTTTGFPIVAGAVIGYELANDDIVYAVVATGTVEAAVLGAGS